MIGLALRLLPVWSWLRKNPLLLVIAALACWGLIERHTATKWHDRAIACQQASDAARQAQIALRAKERAQYVEIARHADQEHAAAVADARAATDAFVRTHRVRPESDSRASVAVSQADPAVQPSPVPAGVIVDETDVQRAAEWNAYGVACYDWAMSVAQ